MRPCRAGPAARASMASVAFFRGSSAPGEMSRRSNAQVHRGPGGSSVSKSMSGCRRAAGTPPGAQFRQFLRLHHRLRHAGEGGELVDHAADVADLADDRVGALRSKVSRSSVIWLAVFALQPLGRKLDRRQRVLDLVRDAPRDIRPGEVRCADTSSVMSSSVMT
jgi:hypothetical protein